VSDEASIIKPVAAQSVQQSEQRNFHRGGRSDGRGGRPVGRRRDSRDSGDDKGDGLSEKTVFINRSSKVVKGGRRFSFSALIVVGDRAGKVGLGLGKGGEVSDAIKKGGERAKARLEAIALSQSTIPHEILSEYDGARILLKPAAPGTGLICGKTVRAVVEAAGIRDILSKSLGSKNPANVAKATLSALRRLRSRGQIRAIRGL
jgi:small subunit ribosomal protein S5